MMRFIRTKVRPLYRLKSLRIYQYFQQKIDFTVYIKFPGSYLKVAMKFFRDMTWILQFKGVQTNVEAIDVKDAFLEIFKSQKPQIFWDIGANIGFYSWLFLTHCDNSPLVLAFEPDRDNYGLLRKTIQINELTNIEILNVAVSNELGEALFFSDPISGAVGTIRENAYDQSHSTELLNRYASGQVKVVETVTLDSLLTQGRPLPDLVKIDVEGAESLVIDGAKKLLKSCRPIVIIETGSNKIFDYFNSLNYKIIELDKYNLACIPREIDKTLAEEISLRSRAIDC